MYCEYCSKPHDGVYGSGRFCSRSCANGFSTRNKRKEINNRVSENLTGRKLTEEHTQKIVDSWKDDLVRKSRSKKKNIVKFKINQSRNNGSIKNKLISENIKKYECEDCGIGPFWNGKLLNIQLHHKNGNNRDNRLDNLQFLCPNCHSQTDTYAKKLTSRSSTGPEHSATNGEVDSSNLSETTI